MSLQSPAVFLLLPRRFLYVCSIARELFSHFLLRFLDIDAVGQPPNDPFALFLVLVPSLVCLKGAFAVNVLKVREALAEHTASLTAHLHLFFKLSRVCILGLQFMTVKSFLAVRAQDL